MSDLSFLNYKPNFKRDEKEFTGWDTESEDLTTKLEDTENTFETELEVLPIIEEYEKTKESINNRINELEATLPEITFKENGHISVFRPEDYKDVFNKKETSAGKILLDMIEDWIEGVEGNPEWEEYIEYVEIEEEIDILDEYIDKIIYPILDLEGKDTTLNDLKDAETSWRERVDSAKNKYEKAYNEYRQSMYESSENIPTKREELYRLEKDERKYRQEKNQLDISLQTVSDKSYLLSEYQKGLSLVSNYSPPRAAVVSDLLRLTESQGERNEVLKTNIFMLKQNIDEENKKKKSYKETRRNLYSEEKQKRIIDEYSLVNRLYRNSVLPNVHYIRGFQDQTTEYNNDNYEQTAKSLLSNHLENREKAYETYLIQISTSQTRLNRLECISNKNKSRVLYNYLYDAYS